MEIQCPTTEYQTEAPWQEKEELSGFGWCVMHWCQECQTDHYLVVISE